MIREFAEDLAEERFRQLGKLLSLSTRELEELAGIEHVPFIPTGVWLRPRRER